MRSIHTPTLSLHRLGRLRADPALDRPAALAVSFARA
jgi:hypothetical protein